jgi:hypothetical protein
MNALTEKIIFMQGEGEYAKAKDQLKTKELLSPNATDLNRIAAANIPVDIVFNQGLKVWD